MDVSGWTIAEKMRLPDYCFGNRLLVSCRISVWIADTFKWSISTVALPDPCCFWSWGVVVIRSDHISNHFRVGMRDTVPTSEAEMNTAVEIFYDFGLLTFHPSRLYVPTIAGSYYNMPIRQGFATGGKKLVLEGFQHAAGTHISLIVYFMISGMPTEMASLLAHAK